jgi:hypothetical protein
MAYNPLPTGRTYQRLHSYCFAFNHLKAISMPISNTLIYKDSYSQGIALFVSKGNNKIDHFFSLPGTVQNNQAELAKCYCYLFGN